MISKEQAKRITDSVLSRASADETSIELTDVTAAHLRFARNSPTTSGIYNGPSLSISSTYGTRTSSVTINQFDDASLSDGVERAEALAKLAPENPEHMPVLSATEYPDISAAYDVDTAEDGSEFLATAVSRCLSDAVDSKLVAAGFSETASRMDCIASSKGNFGYHRSTSAYLAETARVPTAANDGQALGSGWASASSHRMSGVDYAAVSQTAIAKAKASARPRALDPGKYVTILEPACVANLLGMMMFSMDARRADEGRSYFSAGPGDSRRNQRLFADSVTVYSDPQDPLAPAAPWGGENLAQKKRLWIENGRLINLHTSRYWAQKTGTEAVPFPSNIIMKGGAASLDDLIASTERGLLVTSLWYIRGVDPRTMLFTGLTRDGVYLIENGKISYPVQNFRWNDSPVSVLKNIEAMSTAVRMPPRPTRFTNVVVPALKVREFEFTSVSEAV